MKNFYKFLPFLIFLYGGFNCYTMFTEHEEAYENLTQQLESADAQLAKVKKKVAGIKQNEDKLREYESKVSEVRKQIDELKTRMPAESDRTAVLQELNNTAQELNLKEVNFNPVPKIEKGMYSINSVSLGGKGTYLQFLILFEKILSNKRFFNIDNFLLTESPADNKGRFIFVNVRADIQTFEYNLDYKEPVAEVPPQT